MKNRNLQIAVAALALGVQLASPATAGIQHADLSLLSTAVATGQTAELDVVLGQSPALAAAVARVGENEGLLVQAKATKRGNGRNDGNGRNGRNGRNDDRAGGNDRDDDRNGNGRNGNGRDRDGDGRPDRNGNGRHVHHHHHHHGGIY